MSGASDGSGTKGLWSAVVAAVGHVGYGRRCTVVAVNESPYVKRLNSNKNTANETKSIFLQRRQQEAHLKRICNANELFTPGKNKGEKQVTAGGSQKN